MKKKGFTLIELIVSIAILGIISVVVLSIFNTGLLNIQRAGKITQNTISATTIMDYKILNAVVGDLNVSETTISIPTPGVSTNISITGRLIIHNSVDDKGNSITIKSFIPN